MRITTTSENKSNLRLWAVGFWLMVWQAVGMAAKENFLFATPFAVAKTLLQLLGQGGFWQTVLFSLARIAAGFLLAAVLSVALGVAAGRLRFVDELLSPLLAAIKATPVASFIIVALIWCVFI